MFYLGLYQVLPLSFYEHIFLCLHAEYFWFTAVPQYSFYTYICVCVCGHGVCVGVSVFVTLCVYCCPSLFCGFFILGIFMVSIIQKLIEHKIEIIYMCSNTINSILNACVYVCAVQMLTLCVTETFTKIPNNQKR